MSGYRESLCGCCADCGSCLVGWCIPGGNLCLQAAAVENVHNNGFLIPYCIVYCIGSVGGAINRERIRDYFDHHPNFCGDYCVWYFCGPCAGCQDYREVYFHKHERATKIHDSQLHQDQNVHHPPKYQ